MSASAVEVNFLPGNSNFILVWVGKQLASVTGGISDNYFIFGNLIGCFGIVDNVNIISGLNENVALNFSISISVKNFGRAEDNGFINGIGVDMPAGILAEKGGIIIGFETNRTNTKREP